MIFCVVFSQNRNFLRFLSILLSIAVWWVVSLFFPPSIIPGPLATFLTLLGDAIGGSLWYNVGVTLERVLIGFVLAVFSGTLLGIAMGLSYRVENFLDFIVLIILSIPSPALAIISLMWFGLNQWATVAVSYAIVLPLITIHVQEGMKNVNVELVEMSKSFNADRRFILTSVVLPSLGSYVYSASRLALGVALKVAVIAELLGVSSGIGYELQYYFSLFNMNQVFAWTVVFTILVLLFDVVIFGRLERSLFKWRRTIANRL